MCVRVYFISSLNGYYDVLQPFKQSKRGKQAPFQSRIQMCQLLFRDIPNVVVSEAERICFEKASDGL